MAAASQPTGFNFETYTVQALADITKKLDSLNSVFVPREEIMLMHNQLVTNITTLNTAVELQAKQIADLKETDDRQEGRISSSRFFATIIATAASAIVMVVGFLVKGH